MTEVSAIDGLRVVEVGDPGQVEIFRELLIEYAEYLGLDLGFQGFQDEVSGLPGRYSPPGGCMLLAFSHGKAAGCVALRDLGEDACEMKRLFVRPDFRGYGIGRALAEQVIAFARRAGYGVMYLDTLDTLRSAMRLYVSLGFTESPAYYSNPLPGVVYWKLDLRADT